MRANADALALDATLLAAGGGSAGGHMALCLATCPAYAPVPPVLAAVAYNPLVDLDQAAGTNGLPPAGAEAGDLSPLRHAGLSTPPVLIQHGTADRVVPIDGSRRFRDATPGCELIEYEGAAHGFFNPPVSQERYEATTAATLAFLGRVAAIPAST
jgi:acetyl esterase/lipase